MPSTNENNFRGLGFWGIRFRAGLVLLVIFAVHSIAAGAQQSFSQLLRDGLQLLRAGNHAGERAALMAKLADIRRGGACVTTGEIIAAAAAAVSAAMGRSALAAE